MLKDMLSLNGVKVLNKGVQKEITGGGYNPWDNDGCPWLQCKNAFGRCSVFACPDSIHNQQ